MSKKLRQQIEAEMPKAFCARNDDGGCSGRLTVEHAFGRTHEARWNLIFLCWRHHLGDLLDKRKNRYLAYKQATLDDLKRSYPKTWPEHEQRRTYLASLYK